jgi:excisionase family DNA binding protein
MPVNQAPDVMGEPYYTVKEVAERFKVSRQAVYDWISEGRLRAVKVGNRTRIPQSAIQAFVRPVEPGEALESDTDD